MFGKKVRAEALLNGRQPPPLGRGAPYRRRRAPVEGARDLPRMRRPRRPT